MTTVDSRSLTGRAESHLCSPADAELLGARVHGDVVQPFLALSDAARAAGFDLRILSGFRGFEHQLSIWNRKASGELPVLDANAAPVNIRLLSKRELALTILRWSALPGASRHHWGTDLDVYDLAAKPERYEVELVPAEVDAGGMFGPLHEWLDQKIAARGAFGFFRPYDRDRDGVAPERWHLSYVPVAAAYEPQLTTVLLREALEPADMKLKDVVLENLDEIYERFVINTNKPLA